MNFASIKFMDISTPIELLILKIQEQDIAIQKLTLLVQEQLKEIASLKAKLLVYENKKNSGNSHIPPSKDENRPLKNQSLRVKSDKKPGGQPQHEGTTLEYTEVPDTILNHIPHYCNCCGYSLCDVPAELIEARRVIDIPPIKPICIEHRLYQKTCNCGYSMKGAFPASVSASLQYGAGVVALAGYLHTRQYMPYERMKEFFADVLGLPISTGGINNLLNKLAGNAKPIYEQIKERISQSLAIGADETGMKVNGKKHWFWTWQTQRHTFITHSNNRAYDTIEKHFPNGLPNATLVHDRYAAHFKCEAANHQICMAHLLRDLQYIGELYPELSWGKDFKNLIHQSLQIKQTLAPTDYYKPLPERINIQNRLDQLLIDNIDSKYPQAITLQKNLLKHAKHILTFLYHPKVPPDNNASERAIRNIKVKQKISGQFKSEKGAVTFAILRSIIDTAIKNTQNVLTALTSIAINGAE